ncbi:hypothetical protein C8J57DRAFT_1255555 [Mycena rebaudengoi]|nr:hypothetical protein C8J57DRAFT_1255555 [Mycena rebaudengoi]
MNSRGAKAISRKRVMKIEIRVHITCLYPSETPQNLSLLCLTTSPSSFRRNRLGTEGVGTTWWAFHGDAQLVRYWRDGKGGWRGFRSIIRRTGPSPRARWVVEDLGQLAEQKQTKSVRGTENGAAAAVLSVPQCIKKQSGG